MGLFKMSGISGMNKNDRLLIILSKNPEAGMVKTRLANTMGDEKALEIYEILRHHTALVSGKVHAERMVEVKVCVEDLGDGQSPERIYEFCRSQHSML